MLPAVSVAVGNATALRINARLPWRPWLWRALPAEAGSRGPCPLAARASG